MKSTLNTDKKRGRPSISDEQRMEMRAKIAQITLRLFQEQGYRQISMRRIAKEAGCSTMTLYKYYDNKLAVLHTLWDVVFDELFKRISTTNSNLNNPNDELSRLCKVYVHYWLKNTDHYRLVYMTEGVDQSEVDVFLDGPDIIGRYLVFIDALRAVSSANITDDELMQKLGALICFLNGIAHNLITISGVDWPSADYLVDLALKAVCD